MTRQIGSFEGEPVSREYVAQQLGFIDVAAMDEWDKFRLVKERGTERLVDELVTAVCNLKSMVGMLEAQVRGLDDRTIGSQIIGGGEL